MPCQRSACLLLLTSVLCASLASAAPAPAPSQRPNPLLAARASRAPLTHAPGRVLVIPAPGAAVTVDGAGRVDTRDRRLRDALARLGPVHGRAVAGTRDGGLRVLAIESPGLDPVVAARALMAAGAVRAASPDYRFPLSVTIPDDFYYDSQWAVSSDPAAVRFPLAWDVTHGDTSVVIAIVDTGVDGTHPDLAARMWRNPGEIAGNGLDDDGNGFVDDVRGWDFGRNDADPAPEYTPDASGIDVGFHGTFCAGIAAATGDNAIGIAGASWRSRILPLKVSHPDSGITSSALAGAFAYAVDMGASILSVSLGGPGSPGVPEFFQALVDDAAAAGVLCVAAAGNDGDSLRTYPGACEGVLGVAATNDANARADFSNWGSWVDVAAPGSLIWSTIANNYPLTELDQVIYLYFFGWDGENPYMYGDGTSFACPLVSGACALVRARFPALTPAQVYAHVLATGDAVAYDHPIGRKLDAWDAVNLAPTGVPDPPLPAVLRVMAAPNPSRRGTTAVRFVLPHTGPVTLAVLDAGGRRVQTLASGTLAAGTHAAQWDGRDRAGHEVPAGLYFVTLDAAERRVTTRLVRLP
jgi:subtilisin family serine protease